jgi:predicted MFS family arabinose efflux permease
MVEFGKQLVEARHDPWSKAYLDYNALKAALKRHGDPKNADDAELLAQIEDPAEDFEQLVDSQIEKVVLFFLEKQGDLASRLTNLRRVKSSTHALSNFDPKLQSQAYLRIGEELVLLVNFVELNVTGLRKILKKHDKKFHKSPIMEHYLSHSDVNVGNDSHLQQMYHYGGIAALVETLRRGLEDLKDLEDSLKEGTATTASSTKYSTMSSVQQVKPILNKIEAARHRLMQSTSYVQAMAHQALIFDDLSDENESVAMMTPKSSERNKKSKRRREVSGYINLMSTFLYMTNYYIVAPTSGDYAERLGMPKAWAGAIIGMTPCAALVASVLYSWWSNRSYKDALLFAASCSVLGDVLYALALPFNSVSLIFIGRILNGFGGARAINRRYIADAYSRSDRTAASASFVTAGALGMAVGPALAVAADILTPEQDPNDKHWWTVETAPGWIMFVFWVTFLVLAFFFFEEPTRRGSPSAKAVMEMAPMSEEQPLIGSWTASKEEVRAERPFYKNIAVMTTLGIYFVLKLVLECLLSSTATVTSFYFDWNVTKTGLLLAILGLLMFPANMVVAILSRRYQDREIILATEGIILVGTIGIIAYGSGENYSAVQYIAASVCCFLGTNMLEGPNMSLLSKTIPRSMAKGIFNSGLLAT